LIFSSSAWESVEKESLEEEEKKEFNTFYELFLDYTEFSTIQGLNYIFISYQTIFGKIFWSLVVLLMLLLGSYWCNQAYQDWQENPVQTMVKTTSFTINEVISCAAKK
jgi:hypothetical protein